MSDLGYRLLDISNGPSVSTLGEHSKSNNWFEISVEGFKRSQSGRPMGFLIREAVANAFDLENISNVNIEIQDGHVTIEDDSTGFINPDLIFTIFLTDKEGSHLKRGRKGRGLKELISACDRSIIETVGYTITFNENGRLIEHNNKKVGTKIEVFSKSDTWNNGASLEAISFLQSIIRPDGVDFIVNGQKIIRPEKIDQFECGLNTITIENGKEELVEKEGEVILYKLRDGEYTGSIFELGIPVQKVNDLHFNINVQMRIPLNDTRDTIAGDYLRKNLFYQLVSQHIDNDSIIPDNKLFSSWITDSLTFLDYESKEKYKNRILKTFKTSKTKFAKKSKNSSANLVAEQLGYEIVDLEHLPETVVDNLYFEDSVYIARKHENKNSSKIEPNQVQKLFLTMIDWLLIRSFPDLNIKNICVSQKSYENEAVILNYSKDDNLFKWNVESNVDFVNPLSKYNLILIIGQIVSIYHSKYIYSNTQTSVGAQIASSIAMYRDDISNIKIIKRKTVIINCVDCNIEREIMIQDKFHTTRCHVCKKKFDAARAKERRALAREYLK